MFNKEPTVIINGLSGLITQILPLMVVMGLITLSPEKLAAWISVVGLVLTFVSTTLLRSQVIPTARADAQVLNAIQMPKTSTTLEDVKQVTAKQEEKNEEPKAN